ncbi:hypothetical protein C8N40_111115 [Pontibacter mucosus]|uniref:Uncharacterized protein n=1 Tax=Pontibacter mucosus TaxID=1649266 RepID=A0A2T5YD56_9BACT|nr:hypothetical protein [Pontibacter mucosus]PTX14450.1 hypothetical protein C8N40_111115 [Pontibacter mucosus]
MKHNQKTIYFQERQMEYFQEHTIDVQKFTRYAVDDKIEEMEMKKQGFVKKYVKEEEAGR